MQIESNRYILQVIVAWWVLPLMVGDNSAFSPIGLTARETRRMLEKQGSHHAPHFKSRGMHMAFHTFLFLLVVCLVLFTLALLWRLDWLAFQPSHSRAEVKGSRLHRRLQPRTPDDCPACRLASSPASGEGTASAPVQPCCEVKSRRGAAKRIDTQGFACSKQQCRYFGNTDARMHAAFGRWQAWAC